MSSPANDVAKYALISLFSVLSVGSQAIVIVQVLRPHRGSWPLAGLATLLFLQVALYSSPLCWTTAGFWLAGRQFTVSLLVTTALGTLLGTGAYHWWPGLRAWATRLRDAVLCLGVLLLPLLIEMAITPTGKGVPERAVSIAAIQIEPPAGESPEASLDFILGLEAQIPVTTDIIAWPEAAYPYVEDLQATTHLRHLTPRERGIRVLGSTAGIAGLIRSPKLNAAIVQTRSEMFWRSKTSLVPYFESRTMASVPGPTVFDAVGLRIAVLICYEAFVFQKIEEPIDLILVLSSDKWDLLDWTRAASIQAARRLSFVYQVPVLRVSTRNSIITDHAGRVLQELPAGNGVLTAHLRLGA